MAGWVIFLLGCFDLILGVYIKSGYMICFPIALAWFIMMLRSDTNTKKAKRERRILLQRIQEMENSD